MGIMRLQKFQELELSMLLETKHLNKNRFEYWASQDIWKLDDKMIPVADAAEVFDADAQPYFRLALAKFAKSKAADTVKNLCHYLIMWRNECGGSLNVLDEATFFSRKQQLGLKREYQLSTIRGFLRYWNKQRFYGVSNEFLNAIAILTFRENPKGVAVKSNDPKFGALTPIESQAVLDGINNALSDGLIRIDQYLLIFLLFQRGVRPIQVRQLRFKDFYSEGEKLFVNMPRGKQENVPYRGEFSEFEVSEDLFIAVKLQQKSLLDKCGEAGFELESIKGELPVFPDFSYFLEKRINKESDVEFSHHANSDWVSNTIRDVAKLIEAYSERTGKKIHLTAKRFRYTMGTDMAREGYGVAPIAVALDHQDTQNAGVYIESAPEIAARLDRKLGKMLAPLAQAFQGVIVKDESEAIRGNDPTSRIRTIDGAGNVGNCGSFGFCAANAPVGCYTCNRFQPWLDAPHHEILDSLLVEREEILHVTKDETIARQLDRSILAVEDVIQKCAKLMDEREAAEYV